MPPRPLRPCKNPVCPKLTRDPSGYCDICKPEAELRSKVLEQARERARGSSTQRGYDAAWRTIRRVVLEEACGLCQDCRAEGRYAAASEVHHIDGDSHNNHKRNLVALCRDCHDARHGGSAHWRPSIKAVGE